MALTQVTGPYPIFTDLDGTPLDDGYLYIGAINQDPEQNPIQVFWDANLTIPATQPIRTSNGYAYRNGTPALLYTAGEFSITIRNKRKEFVLYSPVGYGFDPAAVSASVVQNDFTGNGVQVAFVLSASPSTKLATSVFINGVYQEKDSYSISGNTLTFTVAPPLSSSIEVMSNETGVINGGNATAITYTAGFAGAIQQTVQTKLEQIVNVNDFGADPTGVNDSSAAFAAAIAAVDKGGTIFLDGVYKTTEEILITKTLSIVGQDARGGNVVDPYASRSCIITESGVDAAGILVDNCLATFKNFVLVNGPTTPAVRTDGIRAQGGNGSLKIYDLLVEGFQIGINSTTNYYNVIENTSIAFCDICLRFDYCYNVNLVGMKLRCNDTPVFSSATYGMALINSSQVNMFGGAIENFHDAAVYMPGGANSVALFGVYFENGTPASTSYVIQADAVSNIVAIGCHVYMSTSERFITVLDGGSVGVRVYSRNNRIVYPTSTKTVDLYVPLVGDATASWDIAGDNWASPIGANVTYFTWEGEGGDGNLNVQYPIGHPDYLKPINSNPYVQNAWAAPPTLPVSSQTGTELPTLVSFANQGGATDDPLNLDLTTWGFNPYMTVYQKDQWEKVGTRLPNQTNSTATTVAGLVTDFNALLQKMRDNGIMI
jgi:hypothetical protein